MAAGMNMHVFTTGRGTPYGLAMVPVVKVSSNTPLAERWHDLIDLDAGPIIAQEVIDCSHRDGIDDLARKGRDVERTTLARAVRWHLEHRLLVQGDRVVVFG